MFVARAFSGGGPGAEELGRAGVGWAIGVRYAARDAAAAASYHIAGY